MLKVLCGPKDHMALEGNLYTFLVRIYKSKKVCATVCATKSKKTKPRKHSVFGAFLACLGGFEPLAFRVGGQRGGFQKTQTIPKKVPILGKFWYSFVSALVHC